ncbi:MAG: virulence RhuM family protein, partial [Anaeroplasmataceae bacterium]|nr:virulence RhuM family protein [Anaeroplasmataceae bacterium]
MLNNKNNYDLIKFEDGEFSLDVNVSPQEDTVWLTQKEISLLYGKARNTITEHIRSIFKEMELDEFSVCRKTRHTATDGKTYALTYYNLDVILAVGYRVKSKRGILFRKWATSILKQYMLNGYSINEKRCLECQENLVSLNNKVEHLLNENHSTLQRLDSLE